jgi:predicted secreted Zn-dependent protease
MALVLGAIAQGVGCARPHPNGVDGQPPVEVIHHSRSYAVNPLKPDDLMRSISDQWRCGGIECKIGETQSRTTFNYGLAMTPARTCALTSVHVKVETTITIPRWNAPGLTSGARLSWWSQIEGAVVRHERQHVSIAEDGGKAIAAALMHLTGSNCPELAQMAAATASQELQRVEQLQADFDRAQGPLQITAPPP